MLKMAKQEESRNLGPHCGEVLDHQTRLISERETSFICVEATDIFILFMIKIKCIMFSEVLSVVKI